jgi:hypothetical protein
MGKSMKMGTLRKHRCAWGSACLGATTVLAVSACGQSSADKHTSSSSARPSGISVCLPVARDAVGRFLSVPPNSVANAASVGNNSYPQCTFTARVGQGTHVQVIANDDNGPQPYFVLERTAVEAGQQFTVNRMIAAPVAVTGLGIEADWFPAETQLMATDGVQLISVTVNWPHATEARKRALAELLTRTYLKNVKGAQLVAKGYP